MVIIYKMPKGFGWSPITCMVKLAEELFEAKTQILYDDSISKLDEVSLMIPRWQQTAGQETCLMICPAARDLLALSKIRGWRKQFRFIAAWVIDSFWTHHIPRSLKISHPFDHLFVTTAEDVPEWERRMKTPVTWMAWASDVLRMGGAQTEKRWDLVRVGRQPDQWDDDSTTSFACRKRNLSFHGRPQLIDDPVENQKSLMRFYGQSKFLLAFSNLANPASYTHPTREYITGRWVDALACGVTVAGIAPKSQSIDSLLWDGALLELDTVEREQGLDRIAGAVEKWHHRQAENNYRQALQKLDWRWRFEAIAQILNESPERLEAEIALLRHRLKTDGGVL